jgi:hypothetical protein
MLMTDLAINSLLYQLVFWELTTVVYMNNLVVIMESKTKKVKKYL